MLPFWYKTPSSSIWVTVVASKLVCVYSSYSTVYSQYSSQSDPSKIEINFELIKNWFSSLFKTHWRVPSMLTSTAKTSNAYRVLLHLTLVSSLTSSSTALPSVSSTALLLASLLYLWLASYPTSASLLKLCPVSGMLFSILKKIDELCFLTEV